MPQSDVLDDSLPGAANTCHMVAIDLLSRLMACVPSRSPREAYLTAAINASALGRTTPEGRRRAVRYLRELHLLDPSRILYRGDLMSGGIVRWNGWPGGTLPNRPIGARLAP